MSSHYGHARVDRHAVDRDVPVRNGWIFVNHKPGYPRPRDVTATSEMRYVKKKKNVYTIFLTNFVGPPRTGFWRMKNIGLTTTAVRWRVCNQIRSINFFFRLRHVDNPTENRLATVISMSPGPSSWGGGDFIKNVQVYYLWICLHTM